MLHDASIDQVEMRLGFKLPERHKRALLDSSDPIHGACDFLLPRRTEKMRGIVEQNELLRAGGESDPWPEYLVAFASNGCGDYFAYDLRSEPYSIIYIDPDATPHENVAGEDSLRYDSFESWYESKIA
jgi:hypothetical protein